MTGGSHNWFISIAPEGSKPGTKHDIDFYSSTSFYDNSSVLQLNDRLPPRGWSSCNPDYDPAPEVVAMGATGVYLDTDSGRDDSSLNVGEDENFDDSFTSAPASPSSTSNDFGETNGPSLYE